MNKIIGDTEYKPTLECTIHYPGAGDSAYRVAVNNGFIGTEIEWLASLKGPEGLPGPAGKDGVDGKNGINGTDGVDGKDGVNGKDGYTPVKGVDYFDGKDGVNGKDGAKGQDGYTPIKGTDYWTEEDVRSIETYCSNYIDTQITQAIGGAY